MRHRAGRWLLLLGTLGSAVLGQYYFAKKPDYFWDGVTFYALAIVFMLVLVRGTGRRVSQTRPASVRLSREALVRAALVGLGLLLGLIVVLQLTDPHENYWPIFWLWIAAMGLYLLGFARLGRVQVAKGK